MKLLVVLCIISLLAVSNANNILENFSMAVKVADELQQIHAQYDRTVSNFPDSKSCNQTTWVRIKAVPEDEDLCDAMYKVAHRRFTLITGNEYATLLYYDGLTRDLREQECENVIKSNLVTEKEVCEEIFKERIFESIKNKIPAIFLLLEPIFDQLTKKLEISEHFTDSKDFYIIISECPKLSIKTMMTFVTDNEVIKTPWVWKEEGPSDLTCYKEVQSIEC
ncbi:uncharacterized protein LOC134827341 [Culicoides brevitarsis]|uniref:uncharacterized protein LOC134827341 n=1 Tax=Culicoides brevitarsis TaxID=469753 RepID=UPI00307B8EB1